MSFLKKNPLNMWNTLTVPEIDLILYPGFPEPAMSDVWMDWMENELEDKRGRIMF